jgi:hypothetical protein
MVLVNLALFYYKFRIIRCPLSTLILSSPLDQAATSRPHDGMDDYREGIDDLQKKNLNLKKKRFMVPCDRNLSRGINVLVANNLLIFVLS